MKNNSTHLLATLTGVALGIVAGNLIYDHVIAPKIHPDETPEGAGEKPEEMAGESKEKKQEAPQAEAPAEDEIPIHVTDDNTKEAGETPEKIFKDTQEEIEDLKAELLRSQVEIKAALADEELPEEAKKLFKTIFGALD